MQSCCTARLLLCEPQHPGTVCPSHSKFEFAASPAPSFTMCLRTDRHTTLLLTGCILVHLLCLEPSAVPGSEVEEVTALLVARLVLAQST